MGNMNEKKREVARYLHEDCGFPRNRATRMADEACRNFRIEQANILKRLSLEVVDGWKIVCAEGKEPGQVTFGALKSKVQS